MCLLNVAAKKIHATSFIHAQWDEIWQALKYLEVNNPGTSLISHDEELHYLVGTNHNYCER